MNFKFLKIIAVTLTCILGFNICSNAISQAKETTFQDGVEFNGYLIKDNLTEDFNLSESDLNSKESYLTSLYANASIDKSSVSKKTIIDNDKLYNVINYMIKGADIEDGSCMTLVYDTDFNIISTQYIIGQTQNDGSILAKTISNEKIKAEIKTDSNGNVTSVSTYDDNQHKQRVSSRSWSSFFKCFDNCLSSKGVAAWLCTAIGVGCSVACAITAGLGCIACISGIGAVSTVTIKNCASKCK
ncbi:MAG: hypothetical protein LBR30_02975 [Clostridioides sp.]|jgi:hypothetical protein|nr:hypothetical protein [Clostridioides sp.]